MSEEQHKESNPFKAAMSRSVPATGKFMGTKLHLNISDAEYRRMDGMNQSFIKAVHKQGPVHAEHYEHVEREQTKAMLIGSLFHCMVLEPELVETRYARLPANVDRRTTVGKAAYAEFENYAQGKDIITDMDWMVAEAMAFNSQSVLAESIKRDTQKGHEPQIHHEAAFTSTLLLEWSDDNGSSKVEIPIKGKLDSLVKFSDTHWRIYDLKSMACLGDDEVVGAARGGCWNIQSAFYADAMRSMQRIKDSVVDFHYIACEKDLPNKAREYSVSDMMFMRGRNNYLKAMLHHWLWNSAGRPSNYEAYAGVGELNA